MRISLNAFFSKPDVLPSDPTPEQGSWVLTSLGSCFLEHVVSSTAIGLCQCYDCQVATLLRPHLIRCSHKPPLPTDQAELAGPSVCAGAIHHGGGGLIPEAPVTIQIQTVLLI